jgi:hypothetical protein
VYGPTMCVYIVALWMCVVSSVQSTNCGQDIHHATCDVMTELVNLEFCRLVASLARRRFFGFICKMGVAPMNGGHGNKLVTDL